MYSLKEESGSRDGENQAILEGFITKSSVSTQWEVLSERKNSEPSEIIGMVIKIETLASNQIKFPLNSQIKIHGDTEERSCAEPA